MSKRGFDEELLLPAAADWGQSASPTPPASPTASPLRLPGAWPSRDERDNNASEVRASHATLYETLSDLYSTVTLKNLLYLPYHLARRFFRRQIILAVPVIRDDGARKKRLVDLGPADRPESKSQATKPLPQPKPRPVFTRRVLLSSELKAKRLASKRAVPGQWPDGPTAQQAVADNVWMSLAKGARPPTLPDNIWMSDAVAGPIESVPAAPTPTRSTAHAHAALPFDFSDLGSPQCASTPYGGSYRANENTTSRKILSPVTRKRGLESAVNRRLVLKTSPQDGKHTQLTRDPTRKKGSPTSNACAPLKENFKKTTAYKLAATKVAEDARKANAQYLAAHKARATKTAELRPLDDLDEADRSDDSFVYANDQSFLSDAPPLPKKSVSFPAKVRAKAFFRDSKVEEMLDSVVEDIKSCEDPLRALDELKKRGLSRDQDSSPERASSHSQSSSKDADGSETLPQGSPQLNTDKGVFRGVPPETFYDDDLDESLMSNELMTELFDDIAKKLIITQPSPPVAPAKPLVAALTPSEFETLSAASQKTDGGMKPGFKLVKDLTAHDFGTLVPTMFKGDKKAWLNDNIINEYLSILVDDRKKAEGWKKVPNGPAPPCHNFASQWYQNIKKDITKVEKWALRQRLGGKNFLDAKVLLYPICEDSHWRLLAFKPQDRKIYYLDSLGGAGPEYIEAARKYLKMELGELYIASEWQVATATSSLQENARDCGVFTLLNALVLLRGEEHNRVLVSDGMSAARCRIAVTLLAGKPTTEMD
jgi:hypothetical protein